LLGRPSEARAASAKRDRERSERERLGVPGRRSVEREGGGPQAPSGKDDGKLKLRARQ
jgi:hypothetical protein